MEPKLPRVFLIELIGAFGLVLFSAGLVCVNQTTTPEGQPGTAPLTWHQPGVFGVALGQGLILAALLALTAPITGGYLNPAITVMLWVLGQVDSRRARRLDRCPIPRQHPRGSWPVFHLCERGSASRPFCAPHINPQAYQQPLAQPVLLTGTSSNCS